MTVLKGWTPRECSGCASFEDGCSYEDEPCPYDVNRKMDGGAVNVVDPVTGGAKGQKLARFDMIPPDVLLALAEHYGKGEAKYPSDETGLPNWMRGYRWSLSVAALERHLKAFLMGEDIDSETGSPHLVAVIWHAIALEWFRTHGKGTDDLIGRRSR